MYKVFFNDRIITIDSSFKNSLLDNSLCFNVSNSSEARNAWEIFLRDSGNRNMFILSESSELGKNLFFNLFKIIVAAGGVVIDNRNRLLSIFRWGKWDLPKGKSEKDEIPEVTAVREVEEECGISDLHIGALNSISYHIYEHPKKTGYWILKQTYWYNMSYDKNEFLIPQINEDIVDAKWFDKSEAVNILNNTWASLKSIIQNFIDSEKTS